MILQSGDIGSVLGILSRFCKHHARETLTDKYANIYLIPDRPGRGIGEFGIEHEATSISLNHLATMVGPKKTRTDCILSAPRCCNAATHIGRFCALQLISLIL